MHLRRFLPLALIGAVLTLAQPSLAQVSFGQASDTQQDNSADQPPPDQAPAEMAPPDQLPAPAADDAQWWLKRGASIDFATSFELRHEYQRFWRFRSGALEQLDTLFLEEVEFGGALAGEEALVHQWASQGKAQVVVVENHPQIWYASSDDAVIYDPYVSRSYFVDAKTRKPLGDGPNTAPSTASVAYHLTKHVEHYGKVVWMVDDSVIVNFE